MVFLMRRTPFSGFDQPYEKAQYVIFGFPMDDSASYRPGSRFMPTAIRAASENIEMNSLWSNRCIDEVMYADIGDLICSIGNHEKQIAEAEELIQKIRKEGKIPVMIGGEHTITEAAFSSFKDSLFVVFDAHTDLRTEYLENSNSHACVCYKLVEKLGPKQLLQIGVRGISPKESEYARNHGISQINALKIHRSSLDSIITEITEKASQFSSCYLSFDMDAYDPAYAPGLGTPEPMGLSPYQVFEILWALKASIKIVGIDINEMCPPYDPSGITAILAAKTLQEILL